MCTSKGFKRIRISEFVHGQIFCGKVFSAPAYFFAAGLRAGAAFFLAVAFDLALAAGLLLAFTAFLVAAFLAVGFFLATICLSDCCLPNDWV